MFQSYVLFEDYSNNSGIEKGDQCSIGIKPNNSTLFPEGEGATATFLDNITLTTKCKKINRKNAPNELSHCNNFKTRRIVHGA